MAVAELPQRVSVICQDVCSYYELEGDSSRRLRDACVSAMEQWHHRPSMSIESVEAFESIIHLAFQPAGKIRVRFKMAGKLNPRVIDAAGTGEE